MSKSAEVKRGDVYLANFKDDDDGAGDFPVVVISADEYNALGTATVIVLPVFDVGAGLPSRIRIKGVDCKLKDPAFAACDQIRAVKRSRLKKPLGMVGVEMLKEAERALTRLIGLKPMPLPKGWGE